MTFWINGTKVFLLPFALIKNNVEFRSSSEFFFQTFYKKQIVLGYEKEKQ